MTGPEFCELMRVSYEDVIEKKEEHQEENLRCFHEDLINIPSTQKFLKEISEQHFGAVDWEGSDGSVH